MWVVLRGARVTAGLRFPLNRGPTKVAPRYPLRYFFIGYRAGFIGKVL
jgi:hypothetical protein